MNVYFFNQNVERLTFSFEKSTHPKILRQIKLLETLGYQLNMPYSKRIDKNLYELRIHARQEIRILYCFHKQQAYIVHAFQKQTKKTPRKEISTAKNRILLLT